MHWSWLAEYDHRPTDWEVVNLGKYIKIIAGQSPEGASVNQSRTGLPFLQGNAEFGDMFPKPEYWCSEPKKRCEPGDTLISVRAPVGEVNRADQSYGLGRGLAALRATGVDAGFLFYGMQFWRKVFRRVAQGTTFDAITERHFRQMWVCLPTDDDEQKAIARALRLIDDCIFAARQSVAEAERLQKGLMQQLLTGRLKPDGTLRTKNEFVEHPKLGLVPHSWLGAKGRQVFRLHGGYAPEALAFTAPNNDGDCLFMKVDDFNHPENRIALKKTAQSLRLGEARKDFDVCESGWLVIAKRGAAITHNRVRLLSHPTLLDPNLMAIEMLGGHLPEFFRHLLTHLNLSRFLEVSSVPQLNNKDLYPRWFALPQRDEQRDILRVLETVEQLIEAKHHKIAALQRLKKSLMQNLLTGRIRLPVGGAAKEENR